MAERVEINSEGLVKEVGLLHMEVKERAMREDALVAKIQQLETQLQKKPKKGG